VPGVEATPVVVEMAALDPAPRAIMEILLPGFQAGVAAEPGGYV